MPRNVAQEHAPSGEPAGSFRHERPQIGTRNQVQDVHRDNEVVCARQTWTPRSDLLRPHCGPWPRKNRAS